MSTISMYICYIRKPNWLRRVIELEGFAPSRWAYGDSVHFGCEVDFKTTPHEYACSNSEEEVQEDGHKKQVIEALIYKYFMC